MHFTALVTIFALLTYGVAGIRVARARRLYNIAAPATTGDPAFERAFRAQQNTLEWMPIFLPSLWLFAIYVGDLYAAGLGAIWIAGRILYWNGYRQAADKRGTGFAIQATACFALWLGALGAILWKMTHA